MSVASDKGGTARASGDHGTAPGVAESGNTITLEEWKRRQVSEYTRLVTGTEHVIVLTEQEMPRAFEVRCTACHNPTPHDRCRASCHRVTWTPWGEEVASEIGRLHIFYMEHPDAPRLHQQRETAANRVR